MSSQSDETEQVTEITFASVMVWREYVLPPTSHELDNDDDESRPVTPTPREVGLGDCGQENQQPSLLSLPHSPPPPVMPTASEAQLVETEEPPLSPPPPSMPTALEASSVETEKPASPAPSSVAVSEVVSDAAGTPERVPIVPPHKEPTRRRLHDPRRSRFLLVQPPQSDDPDRRRFPTPPPFRRPKYGMCWNCWSYLHEYQQCLERSRPFCHGCGYTGYALSNCPKCSDEYWATEGRRGPQNEADLLDHLRACETRDKNFKKK